jgi:hypothetical protein
MSQYLREIEADILAATCSRAPRMRIGRNWNSEHSKLTLRQQGMLLLCHLEDCLSEDHDLRGDTAIHALSHSVAPFYPVMPRTARLKRRRRA